MFTIAAALTDRFAWMIQCLRTSIAAEGHRRRMDGPLVVAIWTRVNKLGQRFAALVAKLRAGTLRPPRPRGTRAPGPGEPCVPGLLPRGFGWMDRLMSDSAPAATGVLDGPAAERAGDGGAGGGGAAGAMHPAPAVPSARAEAAAISDAAVAGTARPAGTARARARVRKNPPSPTFQLPSSEEKVKPVDARTLPRLAYANLLHPHRAPMGPRPPNRIGYGRAPRIPR
jgi:hypothetical protein